MNMNRGLINICLCSVREHMYFLNKRTRTQRAYLDSRSANDFGSETGLNFRDGTCEQDVCLSELLSVLQNGKECSINKSASKITTTMGSETPVSTGPNIGSHYSAGNDLEQSTSQTNIHATGSSTIVQPKFKFRSRDSRSPQTDRTDPSSEDVMGQGTASRRLRLQVNSPSHGEETSSTESEPRVKEEEESDTRRRFGCNLVYIADEK
ncbi:hypothetical protein Hanom_Chr11g01063941 [Helianthus anomalus]